MAATLMVRLGLEALIDDLVRLVDRVGGAHPGRKILTLVASILVGGSHIARADRLRDGATQKVLPFRVGQFCWPPAGSSVTATGQDLMAADSPVRGTCKGVSAGTDSRSDDDRGGGGPEK